MNILLGVVRIDIVGNKYNRLTVKQVLHKYKQSSSGCWPTYCLCDCDCGKKDVVVQLAHLKSGHTQSCGCLRKERTIQAVKEKSTTHGKSNTKAYAVWLAMRRRCNLPTDAAYKYYGGRGIKVCDEWNKSFENFYEWLCANGYSEPEPGQRNTTQTVDRIDVNGDYCPENCRLVSMTEQANNHRTNRRVTYNGETHTIAEWARIKGMKYKSFCNRLYRGWSFERIMTT